MELVWSFIAQKGTRLNAWSNLISLRQIKKVEYEAFTAGLDLAKVAGVVNVVVYCNSQVATS